MTTAIIQQPILQQFNRYAIAHRFTGVQTQLWQHLYWLACTYGQGVCIPTYHLLETMGISRSQLLRARKALEDTGCLRVHKTGAQRIHYTVMLDGVVVGENDEENVKSKDNRKSHIVGAGDLDSPKKCTAKKSKMQNKSNIRNQSMPTGVAPQPDIVMNGAMEQHIDTFVVQHGYSRMAGRKLLEWYRMRKQNGWTMTVPGFVSTMDSLQTYCGGDEELLIKIIDRTLHHGWKGFHPYKIDASPVKHKKSARLPKYETKYEDLDFLEW